MGGSKSRTINIWYVLDPLIDLYEISPMHPIWPYENVSLSEIDSGSEEGAFKHRREGMVKLCGWPHQLILNLFLVAPQYNFFIVIVILFFSTLNFSIVTQNWVVASIGVVREFS